jgi:hypothetical protein
MAIVPSNPLRAALILEDVALGGYEWRDGGASLNTGKGVRTKQGAP